MPNLSGSKAAADRKAIVAAAASMLTPIYFRLRAGLEYRHLAGRYFMERDKEYMKTRLVVPARSGANRFPLAGQQRRELSSDRRRSVFFSAGVRPHNATESPEMGKTAFALQFNQLLLPRLAKRYKSFTPGEDEAFAAGT
jgi:hypothetical protein